MSNQNASAQNKGEIKRMENSLKNMVLSLLGVTFITSACVAMVQKITAEPIAAAQLAATQAALTMVLPEFDKNEMVSTSIDDLPIDIYTATNGGEVVGYAVKSVTKQGYAGEIVVMVGISPEGELLNVNVLSHSETPGLGSNLTDPENVVLASIKGKNLADVDLRVKKDGGDVDALSGATISSRAYGDAIERAYEAVKSKLK